MSENVGYNGKIYTIGTCEMLYYTSYEKYKAVFEQGRLKRLLGSGKLEDYLNTEFGFMYRFPFPDEDKLGFCEILEPFNRIENILLSRDVFNKLQGDSITVNFQPIGICMQKPIVRLSDGKFCLALVFYDHMTGSIYHIKDDRGMLLVVKEIVKNHILKEKNPAKKNFYRAIASRILKGYRIGNEKSLSVQKDLAVEHRTKTKNIKTENQNEQTKKQNRRRLR